MTDVTIEKLGPMSEGEKRKLQKALEKVRREMAENPRTVFQCAARGCDGCSVCKRSNALE